MLDNFARPFLQKILFNPMALLCQRLALHPDHLTFIALGLGLLVPLCLVVGWPGIAVGCLWASGLADVLDGSVARLNEASSAYGTLLDIVSDRAVEFAAILGLLLLAPGSRGLLCVLMLGTVLLCVTSFLVVGILSPQEGEKSFYYSPGLMERAEAFVFFSAMMLWPNAFALLAIVFCLLTGYTTWRRIQEFRCQA